MSYFLYANNVFYFRVQVHQYVNWFQPHAVWLPLNLIDTVSSLFFNRLSFPVTVPVISTVVLFLLSSLYFFMENESTKNPEKSKTVSL